jgi:hypothetical protein
MKALTALAGGLLVATSLAACGSSGGTATSGSDNDKAEKARLEFGRCMRQHGVDMPDPKPGPGGDGFLIQGAPKLDSPQGRRAFEACRRHLAAAAPKLSAQDRTKFRDAFVKFSACMRKEGIDVPDPTQQGGFRMRIGGDPRTRKAVEKCRKLVPGVGPGGRLPGGGG